MKRAPSTLVSNDVPIIERHTIAYGMECIYNVLGVGWCRWCGEVPPTSHHSLSFECGQTGEGMEVRS